MISKNISQNAGAGIAISKNSGEIEINITGGIISENEAATNGGGMFLSNGIKTILNISGGIFVNNTAGTYGGGIWIGSEKEGESTNKITNTTIKGNNAISGGGLYIQSNVQNATYEIDGATIDGNVATYTNNSGGVGGDIRFNGKDTKHVLTISNVNITDNLAHNGGGIYSNGKLILNDGIIKNNNGDYGGGINFYAKSEFEMNGGTISNNIATSNGGGIYINTNGQNDSIFNFNGGEISNNTASNRGGGLKYSQNSGETTLNLKGTNFIGNTAGTYGGGIDIENIQEFNISGGTISNNTSTNGTGTGGIYVKSDVETYTKTGGTISDNIPSDVGGIATK